MESFKRLRQGLPALKGQIEKLNREISHNKRFVLGDIWSLTAAGTTPIKVHGDSSTNVNIPANSMVGPPEVFCPTTKNGGTASITLGANSSGDGGTAVFMDTSVGSTTAVLTAKANTLGTGCFYDNVEITPTVTYSGAGTAAETVAYAIFPFSQTDEELS